MPASCSVEGCTWQPQPGEIAKFCGEHGTPWSEVAASLAARPRDSHDSAIGLGDGGSPRTIRLEWKRRRYRVGEQQTFAFRLTNTDDSPVPDLEVEVACEGILRTTQRRRYGRIPAGGQVEPGLGFRCDQRGTYPAQVLVLYRDARSNPSYLAGDLEVEVADATEAARGSSDPQIVINVDNTDGVADLSNLRFDGLRASAPVDEWVPVPLSFDADLTDELRQRESSASAGLAANPSPVEAVPEPERRFDLIFEGAGFDRQFRLHLVSELRIGRDGRANDVIVRYLPRSPDNDQISLSVGREHAILRREGERFRLAEGARSAKNGTEVRGQPLDGGGSITLEDGDELVLSGAIRYRYREYRDLAGLAEVARRRREGDVGDSIGFRDFLHTVKAREGDRAPLLAARLRRSDAGSDGIDHVVVVRRVVIGSRDGCPIRIQAESVAERHAQLLVEGSRLLIEDMNSVAGTWVNGSRLAARARHAVRSETTVRFGDVAARIRPVPVSH